MSDYGQSLDRDDYFDGMNPHSPDPPLYPDLFNHRHTLPSDSGPGRRPSCPPLPPSPSDPEKYRRAKSEPPASPESPYDWSQSCHHCESHWRHFSIY